MATTDLRPSAFPQVDWSTGKAGDNLDQVFTYVIGRGTDAHQWYVDKWQWRRRIGCFLRYGAIIATAVGGIIPVVSTSFASASWINPAVATLILAGAGLLVAIDKLGGFTSGLVRYVLAGTEIDQAVENFRFTWEMAKLNLSADPTKEAVQAMLVKCQEFLKLVHTLVKNETDKWASEFQAALTEVEQAAKTAAAAAKERGQQEQWGAINLEVTNGPQCPEGWRLVINGEDKGTHRGKSASESAVKPGLAKIEVTGKINNSEVRKEKVVKIVGGQIVSETLTLE